MKNLWDRIWAANPYLVDGIIGALLAIGAIGDLFAGRDVDHDVTRDGDVVGVVLILVLCGALAWRRRAPYAVLAVASVANALYFVRDYSDDNLSGALAVAVWTAAKYEPNPRIWLIAGSGLPLIPMAWLQDDAPSSVGDAVGSAIGVLMVALFSYNLRLRREKRVQEERTKIAEAGQAVSDERLRIARELHDVVAHAMSVVAVQAGVAAHVIDDQPDEAKRMLENVRVTSHEALDEMRRLLGVLRGGDADLAPAPGLRDVGDLVESLRESGVPVELTVTGDVAGVPNGIDLTAYRIVQEALTNVLKHAGPASAAVRIAYEPGLVTVEVVDDGHGAPVSASGGHGILGMRERVAAFGGTLVAAPRQGGGFRVHATLPYAGGA
ncbi:MAG TPA: sensor histidine kinase [Acidimicrobiales bacterium]|nr:sensor histidine kinase [Acidimicrobiales bacterium]